MWVPKIKLMQACFWRRRRISWLRHFYFCLVGMLHYIYFQFKWMTCTLQSLYSLYLGLHVIFKGRKFLDSMNCVDLEELWFIWTISDEHRNEKGHEWAFVKENLVLTQFLKSSNVLLFFVPSMPKFYIWSYWFQLPWEIYIHCNKQNNLETNILKFFFLFPYYFLSTKS